MFILFINHVLFSVESCVTAITSRLFIYGTIGIQWSESLYLQAGVRIQEIKSNGVHTVLPHENVFKKSSNRVQNCEDACASW